MDLLTCTVMPYPWGSRTAIAELAGRTPEGLPEAELWMGAHPVAPSTLERGGTRAPLDAVIENDPEGELGAAVAGAFGPRLPFLLKVLAAAEPLSLQAHPTSAHAARGFADEEALGVPLGAPHRSYKDASHKPELLCALTPFEALSGFRTPDEIIALFATLGVSEMEPALRPLVAAPDARGLAETFRSLMTAPPDAQRRLVDATVARCMDDGPWPRERALVLRLAELYPGDIGVVSSLLLALVHLEPGQAIYLGAGNLHAYLEGVGIEIMASSDNVLRGGLTKKRVDIAELLSVLDFAAGAARILEARWLDPHEAVYDTPASEFRLSRITVASELERTAAGPEILLALEAPVQAGSVTIPRGGAAFVPARTGRYTLRPAPGPPPGRSAVVFRATTNLASSMARL